MIRTQLAYSRFEFVAHIPYKDAVHYRRVFNEVPYWVDRQQGGLILEPLLIGMASNRDIGLFTITPRSMADPR